MNQGLQKYNNLRGANNKTIILNPNPAYQWDDVTARKLVAAGNQVLNLQPYFLAYPYAIKDDPVDAFLRQAQSINDATRLLAESTLISGNIKTCLLQKYSAGVLDTLPTPCILSRIISWAIAAIVLSIIVAKFGMALIFDWFASKRLARDPDPAKPTKKLSHRISLLDDFQVDYEKPKPPPAVGVAELMKKPHAKSPEPRGTDIYTMILVTCYSEDETSIKATLDAIAGTDYDDSKKLIFAVSDGLVKGKDNSKSTPDILRGMMDHSTKFDTPLPQSYVAVGGGSKQHNMAQVYYGSYDFEGRAIPMILVVKCGTPSEAHNAKPGNRGKRDSQLILMNFVSRVTMNDRMTPLDFDIFQKIHHIAGVTPDYYETVLMVDADTAIETKSIRYLTNALHNDPKIIGICGETGIENQTASWVTRIQVFEYFISHQMGKAFESMFGGVTCLPGKPVV